MATRRPRWGAGALGAILLAFAIWNLTKSLWCDPLPLLRGPPPWHLLDALSACPPLPGSGCPSGRSRDGRSQSRGGPRRPDQLLLAS